MKAISFQPFVQSLVHVIWNPIAEKQLRTFHTFIHAGDRVLDIGSGAGLIAQNLQEKCSAQVTLLDVVDLNQTSLPLILYNGKEVPFPESSFDACLLSFVLHHCDNPPQVLKEAVRVSRDRIIILEDTFSSSLERVMTCVQDFLNNLPRFLIRPFGEDMPYNFRSIPQWEEVFLNLGVRVIYKKEMRNFLSRHVVFVLEK